MNGTVPFPFKEEYRKTSPQKGKIHFRYYTSYPNIQPPFPTLFNKYDY